LRCFIKSTFFLSAATICALALVSAVPSAAAPGDTTATVTLTGGVLSLTVQADAGNLGTLPNVVESRVISGALGEVQVNDARSAAAGSGWVVSVISTAFTPPAGPTIAASLIGYSVGDISHTGTVTLTANDPTSLVGVVPAITATGITGDNSATWDPTINVTIESGMASAVYSGTITHSVL
jgi:hypothetical protein